MKVGFLPLMHTKHWAPSAPFVFARAPKIFANIFIFPIDKCELMCYN